MNRDSDRTDKVAGFDSQKVMSTDTFFPSRQSGWVSLDLFRTSLNKTGFSKSVSIKTDGDRVRISTNKNISQTFRTVFYGQRSEVFWEEKFNNLPIEFINDNDEFGFIAELKLIGDKSYIKVPYEVVNSLVNYID